MIYLYINNKIKFNVTNMNKTELNNVIDSLNNYDIKVVRYN